VSKLILGLLAVCLTVPAMAQNLGVHGQLWDIQEEDAVGYMKRRADEMVKNGDVKKAQDEAAKKIKDQILHQPAVPGYKVATASITRYFDPTVSLEKSMIDAKGKMIFPAGTKINPFKYGGLSKRIIVIDARIPDQVAFAISEKKKHPRDLVVLVAGDWVMVTKKIGSQAFYDQSGAITRRFELNKTPSVLSQDRLMLKIQEVAL